MNIKHLFLSTLIISQVGCGASMVYDPSNKDKAESEAKEYTESLHLETVGISCSAQSVSGYVPCSVLIKGSSIPFGIECLSSYTSLRGCKISTKSINQINVSE